MEKKEFEKVCKHIARTLFKEGRKQEAALWAVAGQTAPKQKNKKK
jgi:hypothetical protein